MSGWFDRNGDIPQAVGLVPAELPLQYDLGQRSVLVFHCFILTLNLTNDTLRISDSRAANMRNAIMIASLIQYFRAGKAESCFCLVAQF